MAVNTNPYRKWGQSQEVSDYRSTDTQVTSLVRQQLSQSEYLTSSNRVNPGPMRNHRATQADLADQLAHDTWNEDLWGWQSWADERNLFSQSTVSDNLLEQNTILDLNQIDAYVPPEPVVPELPSSVSTVRNNVRAVQYSQTDPRATWTITHNLGYRPSVEVFNSAWEEIDAEIIHLTKNSVRIKFTLPISGYARLI